MRSIWRKIVEGFKHGGFWAPLISLTLLFSLTLAPVVIGYTVYLDKQVRIQFQGKLWEVPSRVYARPLELFSGKRMNIEHLQSELDILRYRRTPVVAGPGTYERSGSSFVIHLRPFEFHDGFRDKQVINIQFDGTKIVAIQDASTRARVELMRLDPMYIGGIYPVKKEDRVLIRYQDAPKLLIDSLLAVEDREFFEHHGVVMRGIARAVWANIMAGRPVQGGSTITQQLVKNFFLDQEKTLWRKFNEVLMALLLEWHHSKEEILEAYLNEIYLGQDGNRSIHGFGLAAQFYFEKPLDELDVGEMAFLVGVVKGPSRYDPRKAPILAQQRRNTALRVMHARGVINDGEFKEAIERPLKVTRYRPNGITPFPAFLDLVKRQLRRDYREEDLSTEGLHIYTTLDPIVQSETESVIAVRLLKLELENNMPLDTLQTAAVMANAHSGEVTAVVGDRETRFKGFNRALDAERPVGSLIKPAVYLTALERPEEYNLGTMLDDGPLETNAGVWGTWTPENYDKQNHGMVPMFSALAYSYNIASVRLGLAVGVESVITTLRKLGVVKPIQKLPSLLLGAQGMTPYETLQMYQTIANGGFFTPLRAIRAVTTANGTVLQHYALEGEQRVTPQGAYLLNLALQNAVENGTARGLREFLAPSLQVAGKTGTTDDKRDSWFAGYSGDRVAVVWLGADDNKPIGLSGAAGALKVWGEAIARMPVAPLRVPIPEHIEFVYIDPATGGPSNKRCKSAVEIPVVSGFAPVGDPGCVPKRHGK